MAKEKISLRGMTYASMFGAMTAVGAYIIIPLPPVPITLQTFFVSLTGALLGGSLGALSQVVYILLGAIGLPVFAGGKAGFGVLIGPTGGYLTGFIAGAFVTGKLTSLRPEPGLFWFIGAMTAGISIVYTLGIAQLMVVAKLNFAQALWVGLLTTIPGEVAKMVAAALVCRKIRSRIFKKI
jgi:biotin transport system substrate-specific component